MTWTLAAKVAVLMFPAPSNAKSVAASVPLAVPRLLMMLLRKEHQRRCVARVEGR
jgi:hypothetical protein